MTLSNKIEACIYEKHYPFLTSPIKKSKIINKSFKVLYYGLPILMVLIYIIFLVQVVRDYGKKALINALLVPAISFFTFSLLRKKLNAKRPYEKYNFEPLIVKNKVGASMPSRHTFSAALISAAVSVYYPLLAPVLWIITALIAITRIIAGVHFFKDVVAAIFIAFIPALIMRKTKNKKL